MQVLGIENAQAHRAMSDTLATTQLFEHLLQLSEGSNVPHTVAQTLSEARLPKNLSPTVIDKIFPNAVGVLLLDARGGPLWEKVRVSANGSCPTSLEPYVLGALWKWWTSSMTYTLSSRAVT